MSRETVWGSHVVSVVLEVLEVAVCEALSAMDESFGEHRVWPKANAILSEVECSQPSTIAWQCVGDTYDTAAIAAEVVDECQRL